MRNNHVFSILPIGDVAVLAKDLPLSDLAVGQIGIFNADTNLSIDATQVASVLRFYLAVGVDRDGDGVVDDYVKSAGDLINKTKIVAYEGQCGVEAAPKIVTVSGFGNGCCTNDYGIKLHFYNTRIGTNFGFNALTKSYIVQADCCGSDCCDGCTESPCPDLLDALVTSINADPDALVTAALVDSLGDPIVDLAAWVISNPDTCPEVQITGSFETIKDYCGINEDYIEPNGLTFEVSQIGWSCPVTVTVGQELTYAETSGYDAAWDEYMAGGWNGRPGPYRQYESGPYNKPLGGIVDKAKLYNTVHITYDEVHASGFQTFTDTLNTTILAECGGDVTFVAVIDALVAASSQPALATALSDCCPVVEN